MNAEQSGPMILAIGTENDFLHVYQDDQELLSDDKIGAGPGEVSGPLEFFDSEGYRLTGKYDRQWQLLGLTRTEEPPDQELVRWRTQKVLGHLRGCLEHNHESMDLGGRTLNQALAIIPDLEKSSDFDKFLKMLVHDDQPPGTIHVLHTGDPVHNWCHAVGWCH